MKKATEKCCRHCGDPFTSKPQVAKVQKYCGKEACQQARQRRKYRRWIAKPGRSEARREYYRAWAKDYPDYWRCRYATHPEYVERDKLRRVTARRRAKLSAKQTDWRAIAVERLDAIEAMGVPAWSAKQTDWARRMEAMLGYLRWTVEAGLSAKQTGIAWIGGTAG